MFANTLAPTSAAPQPHAAARLQHPACCTALPTTRVSAAHVTDKDTPISSSDPPATDRDGLEQGHTGWESGSTRVEWIQWSTVQRAEEAGIQLACTAQVQQHTRRRRRQCKRTELINIEEEVALDVAYLRSSRAGGQLSSRKAGRQAALGGVACGCGTADASSATCRTPDGWRELLGRTHPKPHEERLSKEDGSLGVGQQLPQAAPKVHPRLLLPPMLLLLLLLSIAGVDAVRPCAVSAGFAACGALVQQRSGLCNAVRRRQSPAVAVA